MKEIKRVMECRAIFGAGQYGKQALSNIGKSNVKYFIDNNKQKQNTTFCDVPVISLEEFVRRDEKCHIVIASIYSKEIEKDLKEYKITNYSCFLQENRRYYETDSLVVNPYLVRPEAKSEKEWQSKNSFDYKRLSVNNAVDAIYGKDVMFNHVEVETINRCNGSCEFCPVNRKIDPREKFIMKEELFKSIVNQLEEIDYRGRFATFSNNEPLLDERIVELNKYARMHLPNARIHLFTNGTLLTIDIFKELIQYLDELIIDNYHENLKLIKPCEEIKNYCENHPELKIKVTIVLRNPKEILTSRGGHAPNRKELATYNKDKCLLPFKQLIIRPDGKVSLCCNDAIGKYTLGDANKEKLVDIWNNSKFTMVRKCLHEGRENWGDCKYCDTFIMG